VHGLFGLFF